MSPRYNLRFSMQPKPRAWQAANAAPFPWHLGKGHQSSNGDSERGICPPHGRGQIQRSSALPRSLLTTALARTFTDHATIQRDGEGLHLVLTLPSGLPGRSVPLAPAGLLCWLPPKSHPSPAAVPLLASPIFNLREQQQQVPQRNSQPRLSPSSLPSFCLQEATTSVPQTLRNIPALKML